MPIIHIFQLDEEEINKIKKDIISGELNVLKLMDFVDTSIDLLNQYGEIEKRTIRYMPIISGLTDDNSLNIINTSIILNHKNELNLTPFTKKNIVILRFLNDKINKIYFTKDCNSKFSMTSTDDFYVAMIHLMKKEDEQFKIDKVVLSKVLFFSELLLHFKRRFYVLNKYNSETCEYENKESLLYIPLSNDNFEENLAYVLSLPEYKMIRPIEFSN